MLDQGDKIVIWTTTPWTLPSNLAIAVHPEGEYGVYQVEGQNYVVATKLIDEVSEKVGWEDIELVRTIKGEDLENIICLHPYLDRESLVILGDHVTFDSGTGLVHTAPGHGDDDYIVCQKYDLPVLSPIDDKGYFTDEVPEFEGLFYDDANIKSTDLLKENNALLHMEFRTHSYPHDWRTKKPVIFRATPQWFASIDKFRQAILDEVEKVDWIQDWGMKRLYNMVENRGDWVISRQRAWGVPLPIFYGEDGTAIMTEETLRHVEALIAEYGSNVWFEREAKDLLPEGFEHPSSPNGQFTKETDIMDVWFDSGSSHQAVLKGRDDLSYPADLYLEGSDQYRGWFNSSITTGVAVNGQAPYKAVLSQGFVLDGEGYKMSKSVGNVIDPNDVANDMGADIIRLWSISVDTEADVRVSHDILNQVAEVYRKIRNTVRFLIQNTEDFDPKVNEVDYQDLSGLDQYILVQTDRLVDQVLTAYDEYNYLDIYKTVNQFCTVTLSNFYMNISKDILYIDPEDAQSRRAVQTVFYKILLVLAKLLAPVIPHTAEEIWSYLSEPEDYVQLSDMPKRQNYQNALELEDKWSQFLSIRDHVLKANEVARENKLIGKDFEAKTTLYLDQAGRDLLDSLDVNVRLVLISSQLDVLDLADKPDDDRILDFDGVSVLVEKMPGEVCTRCRITTDDPYELPEDKGYLCQRCHDIVQADYPEVLEN